MRCVSNSGVCRARGCACFCGHRDELCSFERSQWYFKRGFPVIPPTFRHATPIIAFQSVLIPGAFLSGFLLSPLLVISRHIASKPAHRLKVSVT